MTLGKYRRTVTSQWGEDGVLEEIFRRLPSSVPRVCVEFGASDGRTFSNVFNLIKNHGWRGILIEGDMDRAKICEKEYEGYPVNVCHGIVGLESNNLDSYLRGVDVGLLVIDIDGNDYHVWDDLKETRPAVVLVEFNSSFPNEKVYIQEPNMSVRVGSSLAAFDILAIQKGYVLVYAYKNNAIFVDDKYARLFSLPDILEDVYEGGPDLTYLAQGYDGRLIVCGNKMLVHHGVQIEDRHVQVFPPWLWGFDVPWKKWTIILLRLIGIYKPRVKVKI